MASPPTRPNLRRRYDARRTAVIDAAATLYARRGAQATSMQDLAQATGLAAGGIYHYFGSKEQLLVAICDALMEPLLEATAQLDEAAPEDALRALVAVWVEHAVAHRDHMLVFQQERHSIESEPQWRSVRRARKRFETTLDAALARVQDAGGLPIADRQIALLALLGMVNHLPQWYRPRGRLTPQEIATGFCDVVLA